MDLTTKVNILRSLSKTNHKGFSMRKAAKLLDVNRTSAYYKQQHHVLSDEELMCKRIIDNLHTYNPAWGARQISSILKRQGHDVGRRKASRYMRDMGIETIYPKVNLSKRDYEKISVNKILSKE